MQADERFVWNSHLLREFTVRPEMKDYMIPLVHGFIFIKSSTINGKQFQFNLISRRSRHRAGVRYYMRGVDDDGSAANFVETEQLILYNGNVSSFVQTRGSIPLHWSQRPSLKYKPKPQLDPAHNSQTASIQLHFDKQIVCYGQQMVINLINQKGAEKTLGDAFQYFIKTLKSLAVCYDAFDFHKECSKMQWQNLDKLINRLSPTQEEYGYYMEQSGTVTSRQTGVFRTNCIDCLDRTNVVQSMLASKSLAVQLQVFGIMSSGENIETKKEFQRIFKNVWADNADYCAKQYAGTGALKTDFTRTGKRTPLGALKDGYNSAIRYYYNNFADGFRQDAIDLFLGNYTINPWETVSSPLQRTSSWLVRILPLVLLLGVSMLLICLIIPTTNPVYQLLYVIFWSLLIILCIIYVYLNGPQFVDSPKLVQLAPSEKKTA
jgi:hypothetical protein